MLVKMDIGNQTFIKHATCIIFIVRIIWCIYEGFLFYGVSKIYILESICQEHVSKQKYSDQRKTDQNIQVFVNEWKTN